MQIFRLMGLPDKIIAFDELPEDMVADFEIIKADGFPRYWKKWMGQKKVTIPIPPDVNPLTGQKKIYEPFVEEDSFFYLVDWNLKPIVQQWKKIEEYVRNHVSSDFRLTDKLEDMAKPLAPDKTSGITLEPDDVVIIPIPKQIIAAEIRKKDADDVLRCQEEGCEAEFDGKYAKNAIRLHTAKKHKKEPVSLGSGK